MVLTPGSRLGPYEISGPIGAGGMGEVYGAIDTNLARSVAIKVLPEAVAADADRLARFEREAKTLAALNHPNIAVIYGLERAGGTAALVMELVEGLTLADRLVHGPIPIDEVLPIARQIADALEAAHDQGIIHRDLKPANVKQRPDGRVKVLDFGLAKAIDPANMPPHGLSRSPTITTPAMTQAGVILGTAAYMSPEQARGKVVDKRSDVWAFGCVLYEMLVGRRAFDNDEVSDTLALALTKEPDWSALPSATPAALRRLLRRCLVKDRSGRLPDIGSARLDIEDARLELTSPGHTEAAAFVPTRRSNRLALALVVAATIVTVAAIAAWTLNRPRPIEQPLTRTFIGVAPAERLLTGFPIDGKLGQGRPSRTAMAFAPDGRTIAFTAERDGRVQIYLRRLDQLEATPIAGTEGASQPVFSPNGDAIAFHASGALRKVPVAGGAPVIICPIDFVYGAAWGRDDRIVFATSRGGLWSVPAGGGKPAPLTTLKGTAYGHRLPQFLPDGRTVLFTATKEAFPSWDDTSIVVQSLETGAQKVLIEGGADARYVPTGHLVYMRRGTLMAVPFDLATLDVRGSPIGLLADVMQAAGIQPIQLDSGAGQFAMSNSGSLAYVNGGVYSQEGWSLVWIDRSGKSEALHVPPGSYLAPRISPDGTRVAFNTSSGDWDLMVYDIARGLVARLPLEEQQSIAVWTPDSAKVVFTSGLPVRGLFIRSADGGDRPTQLATGRGGEGQPLGLSLFANAWTPDGEGLVYTNGPSLWLLPRQENVKPKQLVDDQTGVVEAEFSPDGRWLAYASGGPGHNQIYVRPYPALDRRQQIADENTFAPVWRGRELFYLEPAASGPETVRVVAVPVTTAPTLSFGQPKVLFEGRFRTDGPFRSFDVTKDGQRFVMVRAVDQPPARVSQMVFVQNWFDELKARVPSAR